MSSQVPADLRYTTSDEWIRLSGSEATVGISDHAQTELTDIVYVELPKVGTTVAAGQQLCVVESVKAASDIYAPVAGTVSAVNDALTGNPSLLNTDPYGEGWIYKLSGVAPEAVAAHLTADAYKAKIGQ
jgi:glycine cleavage system H protein